MTLWFKQWHIGAERLVQNAPNVLCPDVLISFVNFSPQSPLKQMDGDAGNRDWLRARIIKSTTLSVLGGTLVFCYPLPAGDLHWEMERFFNISAPISALLHHQPMADWLGGSLYLTVMAGHWLPSTRYDYNDLGGAGAWKHWFKGKGKWVEVSISLLA